MGLVGGPPVPASEAPLGARRALLRHLLAPRVHRGDTSGPTAAPTYRAIAQAVGRRCRPMSSEVWQQELERWLLAHLSAITPESTRHRQGE